MTEEMNWKHPEWSRQLNLHMNAVLLLCLAQFMFLRCYFTLSGPDRCYFTISKPDRCYFTTLSTRVELIRIVCTVALLE